MKKTDKKTRCAGMLLALCAAAMLASCAAAPAGSGQVSASEPTAIPSAEIREESEPSVETREESAPSVETREESEPSVETREESEPSVETREESEPSVEIREESTTDAHSASKDDDEIDYLRFMKDHDYANRCIAEDIAAVAGLQSKPEKYDTACVIDMRKSETAYDVDWDYGDEYDKQVALCDWFEVFDVEYYMDQFPMLALQYHYDEDQLLRHFQTVGVHEGRQGCEDFNVGAYMDWCAENRDYVVDLFDGDYALYYMFYMSSLGEQPEKFPAGDHPAQYKAILTKAQQKELDGINSYRKKTDADPLVYDPEMAAFANYRSWVNQENEYVGHVWLDMSSSKDIIDLYFDTTSADLISENTLETSTLNVKSWYTVYANSKPHYEAMINADYRYVGTSNLYVDDVAIKNYNSRGVQFDIFAGSLSTPLNP